MSWIAENVVVSNPPKSLSTEKISVTNSTDVIDSIKHIVKKHDTKKIGVLLSSGIDSAIIAALLPNHVKAYTIKFISPQAIDESIQATKVAKHLGIQHTIVPVTWNDYLGAMDTLMLRKNAPLHPAEVAIYHGAMAAKRDGVEVLYTGGAADSVFGGMNKLLSEDWDYDKFIQRYNYLNPEIILKHPANITDMYEQYKVGNSIDVQKFIKNMFGKATVQMFENAVAAAGCQIESPFAKLVLTHPLDLARIRRGEPKYLLQEAFKKMFPTITPIPRIAFARPMDEWLSSWEDIHRPEFRSDIQVKSLSGDQKWLIFCLQKFMDILERKYA